MNISRRWFLGGLASSVVAPAIVRASSLMPVRAVIIRATPFSADGGFFVPEELLDQVLALREAFRPFRRECQVVPMESGILNWPSRRCSSMLERLAPTSEEDAA